MTPAVAGMRGPEIPGFRWVRPLGQGGFADVFLYRQELPSREVAIKVVRTQGDERGTKELHREADAMTLLAGHPAVVELHGVGTTADGRAYLVMEYCPVADLLTQVRARPMALEKALDTMIKVCGGVEMFHRLGYVHRDIKPSNIMLDAYGKPVLADFGVASKVGQLEVGAFDGFSVLWATRRRACVALPSSTRIRRACAPRPRIPSRAGRAPAASRPSRTPGRLNVPRTWTRTRSVAWSWGPRAPSGASRPSWVCSWRSWPR